MTQAIHPQPQQLKIDNHSTASTPINNTNHGQRTIPRLRTKPKEEKEHQEKARLLVRNMHHPAAQVRAMQGVQTTRLRHQG
jgi:hypothetical protein